VNNTGKRDAQVTDTVFISKILKWWCHLKGTQLKTRPRNMASFTALNFMIE